MCLVLFGVWWWGMWWWWCSFVAFERARLSGRIRCPLAMLTKTLSLRNMLSMLNLWTLWIDLKSIHIPFKLYSHCKSIYGYFFVSSLYCSVCVWLWLFSVALFSSLSLSLSFCPFFSLSLTISNQILCRSCGAFICNCFLKKRNETGFVIVFAMILLVWFALIVVAEWCKYIRSSNRDRLKYTRVIIVWIVCGSQFIWI